MRSASRPVVWSIAGNDSGGGAGLSADQRACDAFGVHLCPVVAVITAQNSVGVLHVHAVSADLLDRQLKALADDMPPRVIKTGLLGSVANIVLVARWVERLREHHDVALVVDPVFRSSTGAELGDQALVNACAAHLLPLATVVTPNRHEAERLWQALDGPQTHALVRTWMCITGGDTSKGSALSEDLMLFGRNASLAATDATDATDATRLPEPDDVSPQGAWLAAPRIRTPHDHGTGCTFASSMAAALALGHRVHDAAVLAKAATSHALLHGSPAGNGAGPVRARAGFAAGPSSLPFVSWGEAARCDTLAINAGSWPPVSAATLPCGAPIEPGLYGIVDNIALLDRAFSAGLRTMQLRIKLRRFGAGLEHHAALERTLLQAATLGRDHGALLFINDHREAALDLHAGGYPVGLHLGQGDLLALSESERLNIIASGIPLGVSSHSIFELCRARTMMPSYISCGPVWPTMTKRMPWRPQGLHNLSWWQRMAGCPVAAIGGIVTAARVEEAASAGAVLVCVASALADEACDISALQAAWARGRRFHEVNALMLRTAAADAPLPHPVL